VNRESAIGNSNLETWNLKLATGNWQPATIKELQTKNIKQ
jgi:hypothetical protein